MVQHHRDHRQADGPTALGESPIQSMLVERQLAQKRRARNHGVNRRTNSGQPAASARRRTPPPGVLAPSRTTTCLPRWARRIAAASPFGPEPTTMASQEGTSSWGGLSGTEHRINHWEPRLVTLATESPQESSSSRQYNSDPFTFFTLSFRVTDFPLSVACTITAPRFSTSRQSNRKCRRAGIVSDARANSTPSEVTTPRTTISAPLAGLPESSTWKLTGRSEASPAEACAFHCKESPEPPTSCTSVPLPSTEFICPCWIASITVLCCVFSSSCMASVEKPGCDISCA